MKVRNFSFILGLLVVCCDYSQGMRHQKFTPEEDGRIIQAKKDNPNANWREIGEIAHIGRDPNRIRERWGNYLIPGLYQRPWTAEEDQALRDAYSRVGPKWTAISPFFPGRSGVNVKNRWRLLERNRERIHLFSGAAPPMEGDFDIAPIEEDGQHREGSGSPAWIDLGLFGDL
ncbi:MAG: hypothetical protein LBF76_00590 [Holosporales bacterium]|jgi:hypothetical protein|nr:hypothetical protein [Holosporales bacterium]